MAYRRSALMEERLAGNRERILHAARALIAEGGYRNAPVTAVAAAAGVSTGQIYRHFPSKADLFVEVLNAAVQHEMGILRAISAEPVSAAERLRKAIAAFVRRALAGPALAYAFIAEPVEGEVDAERIRGRRLHRGAGRPGGAQPARPATGRAAGGSHLRFLPAGGGSARAGLTAR